jgi:hypothetical protein
VLIGPSGDGRSRLACVRKLKALAPGLPVLIISGDSTLNVLHRTATAAMVWPTGLSDREQ